jgi:hypothetical protein
VQVRLLQMLVAWLIDQPNGAPVLDVRFAPGWDRLGGPPLDRPGSGATSGWHLQRVHRGGSAAAPGSFPAGMHTRTIAKHAAADKQIGKTDIVYSKLFTYPIILSRRNGG